MRVKSEVFPSFFPNPPSACLFKGWWFEINVMRLDVMRFPKREIKNDWTRFSDFSSPLIQSSEPSRVDSSQITLVCFKRSEHREGWWRKFIDVAQYGKSENWLFPRFYKSHCSSTVKPCYSVLSQKNCEVFFRVEKLKKTFSLVIQNL